MFEEIQIIKPIGLDSQEIQIRNKAAQNNEAIVVIPKGNSEKLQNGRRNAEVMSGHKCKY